MNATPNDPRDDAPNTGDALPAAVQASLRALRRDALPERDLWSGIAARIGADTAATVTASPAIALAAANASAGAQRRRRRRVTAYAAAVSLALAFGIAWQLRPAPSADAQPRVLVQEAERMTREYQTAWQTLDARRSPEADATALHQIDRSAAEVRAALHQDPDARFLFDRLQSLYARRLDLAQRLAVNT